MHAIGHGQSSDISSAKALKIAQRSEPAPVRDAVAFETDGIALGDEVDVMPVDYAFDPVRGELLECSTEEIALRRSDPRAGTVVVHFPRFGFQVSRAP